MQKKKKKKKEKKTGVGKKWSLELTITDSPFNFPIASFKCQGNKYIHQTCLIVWTIVQQVHTYPIILTGKNEKEYSWHVPAIKFIGMKQLV